MWPDCALGESSGARLNCTFFTASMFSPFATYTEFGVVVLCTSIQYFSVLRFQNVARGSGVQNCSGLHRDLTIIVWGDCCSKCNRVCCYFIVYCPTPPGGRVVVLVTPALLVLEGGVVDVSCCLVFAGVAVVTTIAMGPAVFSRLALAIFGSLSFPSTLLLSSPVATNCTHTIFEVADDVGERHDLADDRGVGLC